MELTSDQDGSVGTTTADGSGDWSITTSALSEAVHSLTATASDDAGNISATSAALVVTIDTTAPSISVDSLVTNDSAPPLTGTIDDANAIISVTVNGQTVTAANGGTTWSIADDILTTLADATYDVSVTATDVAGNAGSDATTDELTVDTTAPDAPSVPDLSAASDSGTADDDNLTNDTTPTVSGTAEAGSTVTLSSDIDGVVGTATADGT
ncbi:MAG: hypothetical protein CMJ69_19355, partial [Planctomycetaceae bacterium]|nr:hypothetical protein [Planctomycetaceae bacterium]